MKTEEAKQRAIKYALAYVCFEEIGAGADENLQKVREIAFNLQNLCFKETGFLLSSYNDALEFLKDNIKMVNLTLPYFIQKEFGIKE
jgi:hypothetical protein